GRRGLDIDVNVDAEATLPALIEAVKRLVTPDRKAAYAARGAKFAEAKRASLERARIEATYAWDLSPISGPRLAAELWDQVRHEDWAMTGMGQFSQNGTNYALWNFDKPYRSNGMMGGSGLGYCMPGSVGSALAHKKHGRLAINLQNDGDFLFSPQALW